MGFKVVSTCNIPFVVKGLGKRIKVLAGVEFTDKPAHTEDEIISAARDAENRRPDAQALDLHRAQD